MPARSVSGHTRTEPPTSRADLFAGSGETVRHLREFDWSGTRLGEPETWPGTLRTTLRTVLESPSPMLFVWGTELYPFSNDACRAILGEDRETGSSPQFLATVWNVIGPVCERVLATGEAERIENQIVWLERGGIVEETFFTFSCGPVTGDDGATAGVLCAFSETTGEVRARRRMALVRAAAENPAVAGPDLPFALWWLVPGDRAAEPEFLVGSEVPPALRDPLVWPLREVAADGRARQVGGLAVRAAGWVAPGTAGPADRAHVLPVPASHGDTLVLTAGLSPNTAFDEDHLGFLEMLATAAFKAVLRAALKAVPKESAVAHGSETPSTDTILSPGLTGTQDERILVVDDNADIRAYLQRLLGEHWETSAVASGREALDLARSGGFGLMLADAMMPEAEGLELVREMRADPGAESLPVVLLSAGAGGAVVQGLTTGVDDYLVKPFSSRDLLARVGAHLVMARLRRTTEIRLDASEQRFRLLCDEAPALIWSAGPAGGWDFVNRAWLAHTGRTPSQELGEGWAEGVHPDDGHLMPAAYHDALARRRAFEVEYRHRRADGSYGWLIARGVPRLDSEGAFAGFIGACTDVTGRKRHEERHRILAAVTAGLDAGGALAERLGRIGAILVPAFAARCTLDVSAADGGLSRLLHACTGEGETEVRVPTEVLDRWLEAGIQTKSGTAGPPGAGELPGAMVSPITVQGRVLGALTLIGDGGRPDYEGEDRAVAAELARRLALHLDYARLLHVERTARKAVERAAARSARLQEITASLSRALTVEQVADIVAAHARTVMDAAAVVVMPGAGHVLTAVATAGAGPGGEETWVRQLTGTADHPLASVMRDRTPRWQTSSPRALALLPLAVGVDVVGGLAVRLPEDRRFTPGEQDELVAIAGLGACALQRAGRFDVEHQMAATLQRSLLPDRLPAVPGISTWAKYLTATSEVTIGGDWYDVVPLDDDRVAVVIGDVSGHGIGAAAVMGQIRSSLSAYLLEGHDPDQALARTARMAETLEPDLMVTTCCGVLHLETGLFEYANAGHPPPLVRYPDGSVGHLRSAVSPPLGIGGPKDYRAFEERLPPGSTIVLYTDGLVERRGEPIDAGLRRLARRLRQEPDPPGQPLDQLGERLLTLIGSEGNDDTALLLVRTSGSPLTLETDFPAGPDSLAELRRRLSDWLRIAHLSKLEEFEFLLACGEAVSNAAEHAYAFTEGIIRVRGRITASQITLRVSDEGSWREPYEADRGRGIPLMRAVMDSVTIDATPTGTTVEMSRRLRRMELS
ncbi:SpoIIE family protein phosphatase [Streptosporangium soli]|nr:SpoIIE family protein phosphatase [Streptosporangium sp. KLBMP 9127]